MADNDGDSHMADSPPPEEDMFATEDIQTPLDHITDSSALSPPDSQHTMAPGANSNGKRPLNTISNGAEETSAPIDLTGPAIAPMSQSGSANGKAPRSSGALELPARSHQSGYTWDRAEDEPGYAWLNKKAQDERARAWEGVVHKDCTIKNRYGDPFEMAEKEQAVLNSLKQR